MSTPPEQARTEFVISDETWRRGRRIGAVGVLVGVGIAAASLAAGGLDGSVAVAGAVFGVLIAALCLLSIVLSFRMAGTGLRVTPTELIVVRGGGAEVPVPWSDLEYAEVVREGRSLVLDLRLRPDAPAVRLNRSRVQPGNRRAVNLSLLGSRLADCLSALEQHVRVIGA